MKSDEKWGWAFMLWITSLGAVAWLTASIATKWDYEVAASPLIMPPVMFVTVFIIWLFRATYVAGGKR